MSQPKIAVNNGRNSATRIVIPDPERGTPVEVARVTDGWAPDQLFERGTIRAPQYEAARIYRDTFDAAKLHGTKAIDLDRVPAYGGLHGLADYVIDQRQRLRRLHLAIPQPTHGVLWHVVGAGLSLRAYADRERTINRTMTADRASGLLEAGLDAAASFFGLAPARRELPLEAHL